MKILMLTPYLPYPLLSGGQIRSYNLIKQMAKRHKITLFALIKNEQEREFLPELEKYCHQVKVFKRSAKPFTIGNVVRAGFNSFTKYNYPFVVVRNFSKEAYDAVVDELKNNNYDLIHAETFYMMPHIPQTSVPKILVEQTIEYLGYEKFAEKFSPLMKKILRPFLKMDIKKIKKWERYYWENCDLLVTMSNDDKKFIKRDCQRAQKIEVVANGVDIDFFREVKKKTDIAQPTILFVGTFKWLPNVEAANFLVNEVWPLVKNKIANAKLWIVGNAPTKEILFFSKNDKQIKVTGGIPDIRDAYAGAQILCAPVFSGKGTRYKILEAMATGTPVVATNTAVEGLNLTNGVQAIMADTAEELAESCIKVLKNKRLQKEMARVGQEFVKKNYNWQLIGEKLNTIYEEVGKNNEK